MKTWALYQSHEMWVKFKTRGNVYFNHVAKAQCSGIIVFEYLTAQAIQLHLYLLKYQCSFSCTYIY